MGTIEAPDRLFDESTLVGTLHVDGRISEDIASPTNNIALFGEKIINICGCVPPYISKAKDARTIGDYLGIRVRGKRRNLPSTSVIEAGEDPYEPEEPEDVESHSEEVISSDTEVVRLVESSLYSIPPEKPYKGFDISEPSNFLEDIFRLGQNIKPAQEDQKDQAWKAPTRASLGASLKEIVNTMIEATELAEAANRVRKNTSKENELRQKSVDLYAFSRSALRKLIYLDELMASGNIDKDTADKVMLYLYNAYLLKEFGLRLGDFAGLSVAEKREKRVRAKNKYFDKISGYLTSGSWITKDKQ